MADPVAIDAALSWIAALACAIHLRFLLRADAPAGGAATRALVALMGTMLAVRGFAWLGLAPWLDRVTFAVASWLPLAATLFCERVLRRHHPLWLKLSALAVSVAFFALNVPLARQPGWTIAFAAAFAAIVAANAFLLLRADDADLGPEERRLARVLVLVALLAAPLIVSDFRTLLGWPPVRLGSLGALLFIHALLTAETRLAVVRELVGRLLAWIAQGFVLALVFAWVAGLAGAALLAQALATWPVGIALLMLAAVVVANRALSATTGEARFLRWLQAASLDDVDAFVGSLRGYLPLRRHVRLRGDDLGDYDPAVLRRLAGGPVSLARARAAARAADPDVAESGEQWRDLLERHDMNHALALREVPADVVLVQLSSSSESSLAHLRAAVVQRLGRRLAAP